MDLKQEFVNACNNLNGIEFMNAAAKYLQVVSSKDELDEFVKIFGQVSKIKSIEKSAEVESLCVLIRDKVYAILIANGEVPESTYIYLYDYFAVCELPEDTRFAAYEQFVDQNLYSEGISDLEKVYLIVLRFFASMANSKKDAFEKFLLSTMRLNILDVGSISFSTFVSEYLDSSKVEIETVLDVLKKLWDKDFYFSLDKTQRRSTFNWSLHSLWLVQKYFNHPLWVSLYPKWKDIFYEHIARDECDEAMYVHFFIYHKMGNSFQTQEEWKMFNDDIDRPGSKYYKSWCDKNNLPKCKSVPSEGKKIIGFLWDRLVENSPFKVAYSLWKALYESAEFRANYEIKIYVMSYFEKSTNDQKCVDMVERLGIEVFDGSEPFYKDGLYHSHLQKALYIRQRMLSDGVDIMIHGSCYDINDFLVSSRVAPRQIFWSHGNHEYDVEGIDRRISHCNVGDNGYKFEQFAVPMDAETFYNPHRDPRAIEHERARYPKDAFILGVIGRLVKVDNDEYLQTVAEIMRQNPNTIFIAAGSGNIESIRAKVEKLGISDRFYMPGHVDPHVYGHIIDLWLNTFPHEQGESLAEYSAKGKVYVSKRCPKENFLTEAEKTTFCNIKSGIKKDSIVFALVNFECKNRKNIQHIFNILSKDSSLIYLTKLASEKDAIGDRAIFADDVDNRILDMLTDVYFEEFGDTIVVGNFNFCEYKPVKFAIYKDYLTPRMRFLKDNIETFTYNGLYIADYYTAWSNDEYILKCSNIILDSELRNHIKNAMKIESVSYAQANAKALVLSFGRFIC